jgi:hypothetical protein
MISKVLSAQKVTVLNYFDRTDAGQFPADLFTEDFQFFVPKFGVGRGAVDFAEMAAKANVKRFRHQVEKFLLIEDGNTVAVEGTSEGVTVDGVGWNGGSTPGGRFTTMFSFNSAGLIERMHIYLDPDFAGSHTDGFRWNRGAAQEW